MPNPYEKPCPVDIKVPAQMLESVAGYENDARVDHELAYALAVARPDDPESLQWVAAHLDRKLAQG